jgi:ubiquinone/menaquinone biosynthesis C-methylase UbiE
MIKFGRKLFYLLPPALRFSARRLFYFPSDVLDELFGKREPLIPPKGMIYTGSGDFKKISEMQLGYFREYCGLLPNGAVLDIGSGMGRSAVALTSYLDKEGKYEGFDVVKRGVDWCSKNISSRFPNFQFSSVPLNNDLYRPDGKAPESFRFPYPDNTFNLIIVNSVFTHMVAKEVENYFTEMARVLKIGGTAYITFFLFDKGQTTFPTGFDFPFEKGNYRLMDEKVKSANVAYEKEYFKQELVRRNGFMIRHLFEGSWRGLPMGSCKEFQDLAIIERVD